MNRNYLMCSTNFRRQGPYWKHDLRGSQQFTVSVT